MIARNRVFICYYEIISVGVHLGTYLIIMKEYILECSNVTLIKNENIILKDINFRLQSSKSYLLVGPSGAGKTSLLRLLNTMDSPTHGDIVYDGKNIKEYPKTELRRKISLVFQIAFMFPGMMTGQIISGTSPLVAVKYQIIIMYMIALSVGLSSYLLTYFRFRSYFTKDHQLKEIAM